MEYFTIDIRGFVLNRRQSSYFTAGGLNFSEKWLVIKDQVNEWNIVGFPERKPLYVTVPFTPNVLRLLFSPVPLVYLVFV